MTSQYGRWAVQSARHPGRALRAARSPRWHGKVVAALGIIFVALSLRAATVTVAPMLGPLTAELGLSSTALSLIGMLPPFGFAIGGLLSPIIGQRIGPELTAVLAMALTGSAMAFRALVSSELPFLIGTAATMCGIGLANVLAPPLIKKYFPGRIALWTTISTISLVVGQGVPPALVLPLARTLGWRWAIGGWAVLAVLGALPWLGFVRVRFAARRAQAQAAAAGAGDAAGTQAKPHTGTVPVWRSPTFWGVTGLLTCNSVAAFTLSAWLPQILIDGGASADAAATWLAVFAGAPVIAAIVVPWLTVRVRHVWVMVVIFWAAWTTGLLGLMLAPTKLTGLWIACTRLGDGNYACGLTLMNLRARSHTTVGYVSGFGQSLGYFTAAAVAFAFGQLYAATGEWIWPLILVIAAMPLGLVGGLVASRDRLIEDELGL
ncbi:MAG: MFS transporter [Bifidobacteriaceae bacterium]|jgi:CP family cyanate transporter-like MFS transporter|nr:MFS transporter [Bifidobacteriaceae bacterium]